jgi:hypothetical protein
MNKNVIALAVAAALAAPLAAQAEVSIKGGLQAEVAMVSGDNMVNGLYAMDASEYGKESGGSYGFLKFSASENLGGGMKALAMWNGVVNVGDTGSAGGMTGRDSYVGLTGGFGTVLAGTLSTPYKSSTVKWDPFVMTAAQARGSFGMSTLHNGYVSNALAYANKFGPATVVIAVVLDEETDDTDRTKTSGDHAKSISINAPVGPVEVAFAYADLTDFGTNSTSSTAAGVDGILGTADDVVTTTYSETGTTTATKLGAKWNSGAITVAGQYEVIDTGATDNTTGMLVTASYAMGANTLSASVGSMDDGTNKYGYTAVGVKHAFSKTTSAHAVFRSSTNDDAADNDESVIAAGLRVGF